MTTKNFKTLFTYDTGTNGDTVEWCPLPPYQNYFVCGTYQLGPREPGDTRKRRGALILFTVTKDELKEKSRFAMSAVLDMKWCPKPLYDSIVLAAATGDGEVCIYHLSDGGLKYVTKINLSKGGDDYMILSLDWMKTGAMDTICCSDSDGYVTIIKFENEALTKLKQWCTHPVEVWVTCFDTFYPEIVYTGGDDNKLNIWDLRTERPSKVTRCNIHTSGVTALSSHPTLEDCLASGSYDETILLWDTRNFTQPTHDMGSAGGIWRLKWKPGEEPHLMVAACIYGGFEIVNPFIETCVGRYREHQSLAYGADWCHLEETDFFGKGEYLVATCSFYDRKLSVSLWDENMEIFEGLD